MAGYLLQILMLPNEDLEEFIDYFYSYLVAVGINILAGHAHRVRAHGLFETCFKGDAKDCQANLGVTQGQMAEQLGVNLRHGVMGQVRNIVILAHTVFDEDWSFADG
ncbi:hypothetical protein F8M41_018193 [Gigaspora margarita]|uniref:Uncharacterized protein n=1 Tax=Gigaspora margarita TaxID=4874 RepID=A0A8H4ALY2_GIGMA|nr:hypothetical protein F8M41_018193 [Gigaspora margarita]